MSDDHTIEVGQVELPTGARRERTSCQTPGWWLVFTREVNELWAGGKAPLLLLIFCIVQGILAYLMVGNESDPTPPKEMVYFLLENGIAVGLFIGLIIGADSISGERERLTLEALLLTPTSRRQIIVGKFLASISPWPAAFVISAPFVVVLSEGDEVLGTALLYGALMGTLMAPAFTGFAILVSSWSTSNKTSLFVNLAVYLMFLIPTQLPGSAQTGVMGRLFKRVNPMESNGHLLEKLLVNNRSLAEFWPWLASPVLFAVIVYILLFWYAAPALRLNAGTLEGLSSYWGRSRMLQATVRV